MSIFCVKNLSKSFGETQVLKDISLEAPEGSFITILGPSGCGKTTMLRIIAGLESPDTGSVVNGNLTFVDSSKNIELEARQRKLGFVFQDFALWPHMSVLQNVAFPLEMMGVAANEIEERCKQMLEDVHLSEHLHKQPEQLSGGQKQRVSIARALVARPKLVLFDEPLSALDANLRVELGQEIRLLSKKHKVTCINVTHDRREAQVLSDYIALMKDGVIHQYAEPETVFREPIDVWAAEFLDSGNVVPQNALPFDYDTTASHVLLPRECLSLNNNNENDSEYEQMDVDILDCIYLEERYEILGRLGKHRMRFYSHERAESGKTHKVQVQLSGLRGLKLNT